MNYFIDTEFMEDGRLLDLISIAIVNEGGQHTHWFNMNADLTHANDWVKKNVFPYLPGIDILPNGAVGFDGSIYGSPNHGWYPTIVITDQIMKFIGEDKNPIFWADWGAYDWVAFCRLFGQMVDLPGHFPMFVRDFQQLWHLCGKPDVQVVQRKEHDVLQDALHLMDKWQWIQDNYTITAERINA